MKQATLLTLLVFSLFANSFASESVFTAFVRRDKDKLIDENGEFRFISFNIPTLHYDEDNLPFTEMNPWRLPDEFEINDALESVRQMGGSVVRIYTLSIRRPGEDPNIPRHVLAPGKFNDEAYKSLDMTLAIANRKGIRIIFPFIDNAKWWGGVETIAGFRGKQKADFWTDPILFEDYKTIVASVINRTNSITGIKYRDDKAILAWETGNELNCPPEWTIKAAAYIKSIDKNHLVIDGFHLNPVRQLSIDDENVDIVTSHYYPVMFFVNISPAEMIRQIKTNAALARGKKAYFVGEFGFIPTKDVDSLLQTVMDEKIPGALIWSLRFHNRDGSFYAHSEPHGGDIYKAYHWPGFTSGDAFDETNCLNLLRRKAFEIRGLPIPPIEKPVAPAILQQGKAILPTESEKKFIRNIAILDSSTISWQGSPGASGYNIERAESEDGPWQVVGNNVSDADVLYRPLFNDTSAQIGKGYFYRVVAVNSAGVSPPSVIGRAKIYYKTLIDEMRDFNFINSKSGTLSLETNQARKFKEDSHRIKGTTGSSIVYKTDGPISSCKVYSYFPQAVSDFNFYVSNDGQNFRPVKFSRHDYFSGKGDYSYYLPVLYSADAFVNDARFLKIEFAAEAQISRVEIQFGK